MKRIVLLLSVAALLFSIQDIHSQSLLDRVRKVMHNPGEEKAEEEAEEEAESQGNEAIMNAMGFSGNVDHEDVYHFDAYIQMELTTYKKNGKLDDQVLYDNYLHKEDADYAMEFKDRDATSTIVFDTKNSAMLILSESDGNKTGFATTIDSEALADEIAEYEEEKDPDSYKAVKTGKTKVILGYSCDEYLVEEDGTEVHMWVSEKLGKEMRKEWMRNQQTFGGLFVHAHAMNGMVLEYDVVDADGAKSVMQVTKIDLNHSHKVNTNGYTIMSMRMQDGGEQDEDE